MALIDPALLTTARNFYVLELANAGGLVTPVIVKVDYTDGTSEELRLPAEIWRIDNTKTAKLIATAKEIKALQLDPHEETADADVENNFWPRRAVKSRFQLFKETQDPNPMRELKEEAEKKAKQAAADRAKHSPPTAERLIPLLPSFSEKAREAASSILINADMMSTIHGMIAKHAAVLQTHELEELRRFDITMLKDRFEAETQDILRQELDRLIRGRQAGMAT